MSNPKRYIWYNHETGEVLRPSANKAYDGNEPSTVLKHDVKYASDLYYVDAISALENLTELIHNGEEPMDEMENWEVMDFADGLPIPDATPTKGGTELEPSLSEKQVRDSIKEYVAAVMPFAEAQYKRTGHIPEQVEIEDIVESEFGSVALKEYPVSVLRNTGGNSFSDTSPALSSCSLSAAFNAMQKQAKDAVLNSVHQRMRIELEDVEVPEKDNKQKA
jgi:hypothetical protein